MPDETPPSVTIVFLVFNRRDELRTSLEQMLSGADYPADRLDVVVVDNASTDGSAAMVRDAFPQVRLIERAENTGVSAWNDGFAVARGDWVLALDDDCYLPGDRLRRAVAAAEEHEADLVSFSVVAADDETYRFNREYDTGLLSFWGCSVLVRRKALQALGGYDPAIFVWANEVEFMMRFFDRGFRHLHLPGLASVHMKPLPHGRPDYFTSQGYLTNWENIAYAAGRHLQPRDAAEALVAMLATIARNGFLVHPSARHALPHVRRGFRRGLRRRDPVRPEVSRIYRLNFHEYASPWWWSRPPHAIVLALVLHLAHLSWMRLRERARVPPAPGRHERYFAARERFYPDGEATLEV